MRTTAPIPRRLATRRSPARPLVTLLMGLAVVSATGFATGLAPSDVRAAEPATRSDPVATFRPRSSTPVWPTATGPIILGETVTFLGRGYGHGVGMNQYGARGRALDGQTAETILAHYYRDTTLGSVPTDTAIRVRLFSALGASTSKPLVLWGRRGEWQIDGVGTTFPANTRLEVRPTASGGTVSWRVKVIASDGAILRDAKIGTFRVRGLTSATIFEVDAKPASADTYRGAIRVGLRSTAATASVTNETTLELYLRGVVPAEMPSSWPTEALRAQAIAARSYAARRLRPDTSYFDVVDDSSSQVYLGLKGERSPTTSAISASAGVVLKKGTEIANAMFHSTGGGATEHNENVYVSSTGAVVAGAVSYLRGNADRRPDGSAWDDAAPYATWATATYARAQLSAWFGADARTNVGDLTALDLTDRGVSGRLRSVTLIGSAGTKTVAGEVFRSVFAAARPASDPSIRSTLFDTLPIP